MERSNNLGIRQGFSIYRETCVSLSVESLGAITHLKNLNYADEICLTSHRLCDTQSNAVRLNYSSQENIIINGNSIDIITSYPYLCTIISNSGGVDEDVSNRLSKARSASGRLSHLESILLFGSETWLTIQTAITRKQQINTWGSCAGSKQNIKCRNFFVLRVSLLYTSK